MRLINRNNAYIWCQLFGWGGSLLLNLFFLWAIRSEISWQSFTRVVIWVIAGLLLTHLMRLFLKHQEVLKKELDRQILYFVSLTLFFGIILGLLLQLSVSLFSLTDPNDLRQLTPQRRLLGYVFNSVIFLLIWNLIYFIFHYVERVRNQQIEALKSETLIRELQLQTIKSHINPHFIFNSLNSIRALIDENPARARRAITELSNILRSSMQAEKAETVSFQKELNIVRDYLELEKLRFEERLHFHFDIDPETLVLQVPPMMLQTLVENAIKHGITPSKRGGEISIEAGVEPGPPRRLRLLVRDSGVGVDPARVNLEGVETGQVRGVGLANVQQRLRGLYGEAATWRFTSQPGVGTTVEMRVPVSTAGTVEALSSSVRGGG